MKHNLFLLLICAFFILDCSESSLAQNVSSYSLQQLKDSALKNNHLLTMKDWQIKEKQTKTKEDRVKRYPSATLNANYEYFFNLGSLTIPPGTLGEIPVSPTNTIRLPNTDKSFPVGSYNNYNFGILVYQPISQQSKINTGLEIDKMDVLLSEKEKFKFSLHIEQQVEQLYYGSLIAQKQMTEVNAGLALAEASLEDTENALLAGKTVIANRSGLQANIAEQEENILKLNIQVQNDLGDLITITGIKSTTIQLAEPDPETIPGIDLATYKKDALNNNPDLRMADITKSKALLGISAAKQSNRPDVGLVAGYAYQLGNPVLPANVPFIGINVKWNLQDIFSNKYVTRQREFQLKQAEENMADTQDRLNDDIEKVFRQLEQSKELITVTMKVVKYRKEEMKIEEDKRAAGMNVKTDMLNTSSLLAKAESDMYTARLSYTLAVGNLKFLTGYR